MMAIQPIHHITVLSGFLIGSVKVTQSSSTIRPTGHASPKESARSKGVGDAAISSQFLWPCAHIEGACVSGPESIKYRCSFSEQLLSDNRRGIRRHLSCLYFPRT
jgi:hypothetical protein